MKPSDIEDQLITFTNTDTNRTIVGRINLHQTNGERDQWRIVYSVNVADHMHLQEDVLLPYEIHKFVERVNGKLVLKWAPSA
jgi:hypothetical protein